MYTKEQRRKYQKEYRKKNLEKVLGIQAKHIGKKIKELEVNKPIETCSHNEQCKCNTCTKNTDECDLSVCGICGLASVVNGRFSCNKYEGIK
jgi:hypothetical protein